MNDPPRPSSRKPRRGRAGVREVAEAAGVAISSVSRVLSGHPDVSDDMRERVLRAVDEIGYQPDLLAQGLRLRETRTIGFVVGDISNPLFADIAMGAESALREAGYSMLLMNSENDPAQDTAHVRLLEQRRVDGLLLSLASEDDPTTLETLRNTEVPVVGLDRDLPEDVGASAVLSDHRAGMLAAGEHLLDLGHRRIGLILGPPLRFSRQRELGLRDAYTIKGLPDTLAVMRGRLEPHHGREATAALLDGDEPVTAIIAGGNQLVVGALEEIQARGMEVGRDISLVSCDAISLTELYLPPIAVVDRDTRELGRHAAQVLLAHLRGEEAASVVVLPTTFIPRPSCGPPR